MKMFSAKFDLDASTTDLSPLFVLLEPIDGMNEDSSRSLIKDAFLKSLLAINIK